MTEVADPRPPRPSIWLILHSLVVIGASLWVVAMGAGAFLNTGEVCSQISLIIVVLPCAGYAAAQYWGTFRRSDGGAIRALFGNVAISLIGLLVGGSISAVPNAYGYWLIGAGVFFALGIPLNWQWYVRLRRAAAKGIPTDRKYQITLMEGVVFTSVLCVMTAVAIEGYRKSRPQTVEHVDASQAPFRLPVGASDVSCVGYSSFGDAVEFAVEEKALVDWFDAGGIPMSTQDPTAKLEEIATPQSVLRSGYFSGPKSISIQSGLKYKWKTPDFTLELYYDRGTKRAYYRFYFD
ncbi:hypothetical protein [Blastopirellula marina]|uniref:Uncharacterized protein n=1 Tax=Blastopirellula marina TaxID=124 RepID=A0A2S8GHH9_9BACT|nr:hypothetical protein [Blastopirellula marina]PQO43464.1 hypothetical protein C5Y93_22675 [Blastopirellula marina]